MVIFAVAFNLPKFFEVTFTPVLTEWTEFDEEEGILTVVRTIISSSSQLSDHKHTFTRTRLDFLVLVQVQYVPTYGVRYVMYVNPLGPMPSLQQVHMSLIPDSTSTSYLTQLCTIPLFLCGCLSLSLLPTLNNGIISALRQLAVAPTANPNSKGGVVRIPCRA